MTFLSKLTSRKFLLALVGTVSGIALALGVEGDEITTIITSVGGVVTAAGSIIAYINGESRIDAAAAEKKKGGDRAGQYGIH